jgi:transglutaminase-like putative cysteine protease
LNQWARQFIRSDGPTGTRGLLAEMNQSIRASKQYLTRFGEGVQTPYDTIRLQSGPCRDFAALRIEAVRRLGYAAHFVSGNLYTPWLDDGAGGYVGAGAAHAWLQVYLPGQAGSRSTRPTA